MLTVSPIKNKRNLEDQININHREQKKIESEIDRLRSLLKDKKIEGYLLETKKEGISLLTANDKIGKYKFLTQKLTLEKLKITMYPIWLSLRCTHPKWSTDILSLNLIKSNYGESEYIEILIDGISKYLNCTFLDARKIIEDNDISIPFIYSNDYKLNSNLRINFNLSQPIDKCEHQKKVYYLKYSDDENMMINTANIKFILVVPNNIDQEVEFNYFND